MSLSIEEQRRIVLRTLVGTFSGLGWCLAIGSGVSVFDGGWRFIQATRAVFVRVGLTGQGHCWLCGMSHAFRALWMGHLHEAIAYNSRSLALFCLMITACGSVILLWLPWTVRKSKQTELHLAH